MDNFDKNLDRIIVLGLYLYSLGAVVSSALMNISLGLSFLAWIIKKARNFKVESTPFDKYILFFLIAIAFSFIGSWNLSNSIHKFRKCFLTPVFLFYLVVDLNPDLKSIRNFLMIISTVFLGSVFYSLWQHYIGVQRVHSNLFVLEFGTILAMAIIYLVVYIFWYKTGYKKKFFLISLNIILLISLILTLARGAWVALIISVYVIMAIKDKKILIYFLVSCLLFLLVVPYFISDIYIDRFKSIFDTEHDKSNTTRLELWRGALLIYRDHWINGIGLDNFSEVIKMKPYYRESMISTSHAHNNFLQVAAETGSIGLISFILLFIVIINQLYKYYRLAMNNKLKLFYLGTIGMIVVYLSHGLTEYNLNDRFSGRLVWFVIGISIVLARRKDLINRL